MRWRKSPPRRNGGDCGPDIFDGCRARISTSHLIIYRVCGGTVEIS